MLLFNQSVCIKEVLKMNNKWTLVRIANGHLSCDNLAKEATDIDAVEKQIEENFGAGSLRKNNIHTGWDNWSGLFIMSDDNSGDHFVKKIYEYFCELENEKPAPIIEMFKNTREERMSYKKAMDAREKKIQKYLLDELENRKSQSIIERIKEIIDKLNKPT